MREVDKNPFSWYNNNVKRKGIDTMITLTIKSAELKRLETNQEILKQQIEQEIYKANRPVRVEKMVENIFNKIKKGIENTHGSGWLDFVVFGSDLNKWNYSSYDEFEEAMTIALELIKAAGYEIGASGWYRYSDSWFKRSGKFGQVWINW